MSGVKRIVLAENDGTSQVTNEDLAREGRNTDHEEDTQQDVAEDKKGDN